MAELVARVAQGVAQVPKAQWDACAGADNPFISWDFLTALERSGSVGERSGWQPLPVLIDGPDGALAACAPAYGKTHSQGEYVFDHGWADAWERAGGRYYPKIQIASPFSPVPGPRLLLRDPAYAPALIAGIEALVDQNQLSSAHATFVAPEQVAHFEAADWLIREDSQFHWTNRGYAGFEDFLADLSSDIVGSALCDHERLATLPFASGMRYFRSELDEHILRSSCPAGVCRPIAVAAGAAH